MVGNTNTGRATEAQLHKAVAEFPTRALPETAVWSTIDHSGIGWRRGKQLKDKGVAPGLPDILLILPVTGTQMASRVLGIELKIPGGRLSTEQKNMQRRFIEAGAFYSPAYSVEQVEIILVRHGIQLRASVGVRITGAAA